MELTIPSVIAFVTLILGQITKKFGWINKKFIPYQNLVIGLVSGVICYLTGLKDNVMTSIFTCVVASYSAGGIYDNISAHKIEEEFYDNVGGDE